MNIEYLFEPEDKILIKKYFLFSSKVFTIVKKVPYIALKCEISFKSFIFTTKTNVLLTYI